MKVGDKISGFETMWNGVKINFLWEIIEILETSIRIKSFVLKDSKNVKLNHLPEGFTFESYIMVDRLSKMLKSGDAKIS